MHVRVRVRVCVCMHTNACVCPIPMPLAATTVMNVNFYPYLKVPINGVFFLCFVLSDLKIIVKNLAIPVQTCPKPSVHGKRLAAAHLEIHPHCSGQLSPIAQDRCIFMNNNEA